jgi:hypothetical protein
MPFGLFKKKVKEPKPKASEIHPPMEPLPEPKSIEDLEKIEKTEMEDLGKIKEMGPVTEAPELEDVPELKPLEPLPPKPDFKSLDETRLKDLNSRIDEELKEIKKKLKPIEKVSKLSLESPEMIDLLDLHVSTKKKFQNFVDEINNLNLENLSEKKTFAAIYKFRACKNLSEIKKELKKIESLSMKAGFIPTKVHSILKKDAGKLVNTFLKEKKGK